MHKNNMRNIRNSKNITLERLSKITGISVGYLCHLEKGTRSNPSMQVMELIAMGIESSVAEIFFDK